MTRESMYTHMGDNEFSDVVFQHEIRAVDYTYDDLPLSIPIDASEVVKSVGHEVVTAFSGGTPTLDLGDGTTADYFIADTSIAEGTVGNLVFSTTSKKYNSAGVVKVTGSAGLAAGAGRVFIESFKVARSWRESMPDAHPRM